MTILIQILKPLLEILFHEFITIITAPEVVADDPIPELESLVDTSLDSLLSAYDGLSE